MRRTNTIYRRLAESRGTNPFELRRAEGSATEPDPEVHVFGKGVICDTEKRGQATPQGRSVLEIVLDSSEGFIPLWAEDTTLRWRFQERSMSSFEEPEAAEAAIEELLGEALLAWGEAVPVKFAKRDDAWDFEIVVRESDRCNINGCVLASAFFPDAGQHELRIYPKMFEQSRQEQMETLIHEIGHAFGLRHFFANVSETAFPSQIFGTHNKFSIMNYGSDSVLTPADKSDLQRLYRLAWNGELTQINGTSIRFVRPFHISGSPPESMVAVGKIETVMQPHASSAATGGT
jgi:Metallo-peptidase family M12B Reprolysin-like